MGNDIDSPGLPSMLKTDFYVKFNATKTEFQLAPIHYPVLISLRNNAFQSVYFDIDIPTNSGTFYLGNSQLLSPVYLFVIAASVSLALVVLTLVGYFIYRRFRPVVLNPQELEMPYMLPGTIYRDSDPSIHQNQVCPVCLDGFTPEILVEILECLHVYHSECIQHWVSSPKVLYNQHCMVCMEGKRGEGMNDSQDLMKTTQIILEDRGDMSFSRS